MSIGRVLIIAAAALCAAAGRGETTRAEKIRAKLESPDRTYGSQAVSFSDPDGLFGVSSVEEN